MSDKVAVFIDIETTGLDLQKDYILEFGATMVELPTFRKIASLSSISPTRHAWQFSIEGESWGDGYVHGMHMKSGLVEEIGAAFGPNSLISDCLSHDEWDSELSSALRQWNFSNQTCIWGSSVHFDKKFMAKYLPRTNALFHYRVVDSSSVMERLRHTNPDIAKIIDANTKDRKQGLHRVLADIDDSIYLEQLLSRYLYDPASYIHGTGNFNA